MGEDDSMNRLTAPLPIPHGIVCAALLACLAVAMLSCAANLGALGA